MNGVSILRLIRDQFLPQNTPESVGRKRLVALQWVWVGLAAAVAVLFAAFGDDDNASNSVLAANAIFTALSLTMAMFFWPRAIDIKNDPKLLASDARWYVYLLTTQLFWTVMVGVIATGATILSLAIDAFLTPVTANLLAACVRSWRHVQWQIRHPVRLVHAEGFAID